MGMQINEKVALREEIKELKKTLRAKEDLLRKIEIDCRHDFTKPVYDPEDTLGYTFSHFEGHGSDPNPIYNTYPTKKDRWSRTCKLCGLTEYTYEQKPSKYEPSF